MSSYTVPEGTWCLVSKGAVRREHVTQKRCLFAEFVRQTPYTFFFRGGGWLMAVPASDVVIGENRPEKGLNSLGDASEEDERLISPESATGA